MLIYPAVIFTTPSDRMRCWMFNAQVYKNIESINLDTDLSVIT